MTAAITQIQVIHGATGSPTRNSAEGGLLWNRADDESASGAALLPVPAVAPGSNYSNYKSLQLAVVTPGDTHISNIAIRKSAEEPGGSALFYKAVQGYAQCTGAGETAGNRPPDSTAALVASPKPNAPSGWTPLPLVAAVVDTGTYDASVAGPLGQTIPVVCGVSSGYGGGASASAPQAGIYIAYSEA